MIGRWIFLRGGRLTLRARLVLGLLFVLALIVLLPLRMVLAGVDGISASAVEGTAWSGRVADLRLGPLPLGTVDAGIRPLPVLIGRGEIAVSRSDASPFSATLGGDRDSFRIVDANGSLTPDDALGALPVAAIGFGAFYYRTENGRCQEAGGTLSVTLASFSPLMPGDLVLSGKARCEGGALVVPMTGPTGMEHLALRVEGTGTWRADLSLAGLPPEAAAPLVQQGFTARSGGIGTSVSGRF